MSQSIKAPTSYSSQGLNVTLSLPATPVILKTDDFGKGHARIDFSEDDDLFDALVESATLWVQKKLNRALISQTVVAEWDAVSYEVVLPYAPISAITSVVTVADDGTETALTLNIGYTFRNGVIRVNTSLGLKVTYVAGYGPASSDVPSTIKNVIGRIVLSLYDRRDDEVEETNIEQLAFNSMALLQPYINYRS
jgi:uncharacterized phiE125 gp8 family phage protein